MPDDPVQIRKLFENWAARHMLRISSGDRSNKNPEAWTAKRSVRF